MKEKTNDHSTTLLPLLARHRVVPAVAGWWVRPAAGGVNNRVYLAGRDDEQASLTVRVAALQDDPRLEREAQVLSTLQGTATCIPELLAAINDGPAGFGTMLVYRYARGNTRPIQDVSLEQVQGLGRCLAHLHATSSDVYTIWPDLVPQSGSYAECFRDRLAAIERYTWLQEPAMQSIYQRLTTRVLGDDWTGNTFCQLHGDLGPGNIIWGNSGVTLIDWEFIRAGDPAEDLAYLLVEQAVLPAHQQALFDGYLAAAGSTGAITRLTAYLPVIAFDSALWWADYALAQHIEPATFQEVLERLERTERLLAGGAS